MILPDGSDFPRDYTPEIRTLNKIRVYKRDWNDEGERQKSLIYDSDRPGNRAIYPYDDHPVVLAYRALAASADMRIRAHREMYLAFLAIATPQDDYDVISTASPRITASIQEQNSMEDLERLLARLDAAEKRQDAIEVELNDDARAQGDALARTGHGEITVEVDP